MMIENILGFHRADAVTKRLDFHCRRQNFRYGIKRLKFGTVSCDIIVENGVLECETNEQFTLCIDGKDHTMMPGRNSLKLY